MWVIIKFDKNNFEFLKEELRKKLGDNFIIYNPKFFFQKYINNKCTYKEFNLLGDYLFCFHKNFKNTDTLNNLKFTKGLKYILSGFVQSQEEIKKFIKKCKDSEDKKGYLTQNFFELHMNSKYKFISGPFAEMIFKIVGFQKNKINILLGNVKTTIKKNELLYNPL
ncbi:MAG: hypothetical protein CMI95_05740 [Pelagibacteraceae bacterium]|nr:hypothetical protein [Pelagibacteraceae bacterium]|tara:strand:- start:24212 stop:24709 length:498 start_codon:yes stop_codon:yes gene_type:complete